MDPKTTLAEMRHLAEAIQIMREDDRRDQDEELLELARRLAELVQAMDEWISGGGFLPPDWRPLLNPNPYPG